MSLIMIYIVLTAPLYLLTFGSKVGELILLDINTGPFQSIILFGSTISMIFNSGVLLVPVFDVVTLIRKKFIAQGFYARVESSIILKVKFGNVTQFFMWITGNQQMF